GVGLEAKASGVCFCEGSIYDSRGYHVATVLVQAEIEPGKDEIPLQFEGPTIRESGLDGPYRLGYVTLYDEGWYMLERVEDAYLTGEYGHLQFQDRETGPTTTNSPPNVPTALRPPSGATNISLRPLLESSAFSDPDPEDVHNASQWQVTTTPGDYSDPIFDSGWDGIELVNMLLPETLDEGTTYFWRVRHQDDNGAWSAWSSESSFTTLEHEEPNSPPARPSNELPADGDWIEIGDELRSSVFSDPDIGNYHAASQWQVTLTPGDYSESIYDSGTDPNHLLSLPLSTTGIEPDGEALYWRVRHRDDRGAWSEWSNETSFSLEPGDDEEELMLYAAIIAVLVLILLLLIYLRRR
ncbi:MAG: hypothetical protein HXS50_05060, partial [Theionarchaea archaeon]|nr:hypothetical protein [Theionarchaea archaeon]